MARLTKKIGVRFDPELVAALTAAAELADRSFAGQVRYFLRQTLLPEISARQGQKVAKGKPAGPAPILQFRARQAHTEPGTERK